MVAVASTIASPSFLPILFLQRTRPLLLLSQETTKKSAIPAALTQACSDCAFSRQFSSSFTEPGKMYSLLHEPDHSD